MMDIQTVNEVDFEPAAPQIAGKIEKAEGLGPEVIGRKVIDPGINEDNGRFHNDQSRHI